MAGMEIAVGAVFYSNLVKNTRYVYSLDFLVREEAAMKGML